MSMPRSATPVAMRIDSLCASKRARVNSRSCWSIPLYSVPSLPPYPRSASATYRLSHASRDATKIMTSLSSAGVAPPHSVPRICSSRSILGCSATPACLRSRSLRTEAMPSGAASSSNASKSSTVCVMFVDGHGRPPTLSSMKSLARNCRAIARTSRGIVDDTMATCRSGRICPRKAATCCEKPSSNMRSASSTTTKEHRRRFSTRPRFATSSSNRRPGVATSTSVPPLHAPMHSRRDVPP
mmetsp:Transcript_47572/g.146813  ORF Transcript_47572/g.146813 Transcript_47572/m.146813 type:complete len:241 (-) Transcript_47572:466-1188(-)